MLTDIEEMNFLERAEAQWQFVADEIMFELLNAHKPFSKDDFYKKARAYQMPPNFMADLAGRSFNEFQNAGYIRKTGETIISERWPNILDLWEPIHE
jgi:hypothetical protein